MTDRPLRIGVWAAVSSKPQAEKVSLGDQERQGREFAASIGGDVVTVYQTAHTRDIIFYHDAEAQMDSYRQLREDVEAGRLDLLWCLDEDRLGRDPALGSQVFSLVEKSGAEIYVHTSPHVIGSKGTGHRYLHAIKQVRAGEDSALRVHRYRMGMRGRVLRGLHTGKMPFGYEAIRDDAGQVTHAEFTDDIGAVDLMTTLFLRGQPYMAIVEALNGSPWRSPTGSRWWMSTVQNILNNDCYAGVVRFGELRAESELIPARWDAATHAAIVRERLRRSRARGYHQQRSSALRGVAICKRCGRPMVRASGGEILRCATHYGQTGEKCHPNHVQESLVLEAVVGYLQEIVPEKLTEQLQGRDSGAGLRREREAFEAKANALQAQRKRLALAYAAGKMAVDIYHETDGELLDQLDAAAARVATIDQIFDSLPDTKTVVLGIQELRDLLGRLRERAESDPVAVSTLLQNARIKAWVERPLYRYRAVVIEVGLDM